MANANEKQEAHQLLDQLDAGQFAAAVQLLKVMADPVARAVANAPQDDEILSAQGAEALKESRNWREHNKAIPQKQVLAELGITQEEIDACDKTP